MSDLATQLDTFSSVPIAWTWTSSTMLPMRAKGFSWKQGRRSLSKRSFPMALACERPGMMVPPTGQARLATPLHSTAQKPGYATQQHLRMTRLKSVLIASSRSLL